MKIDIDKIIKISKLAGNAILEVYNSADFNVESKDDNSPLTLADKKSHAIIAENLSHYFPNIPVISEEGKDIPFEERQNWKTFFLVDPLDGTKEFIKRNGEFTVNIALIENNKPILGVIHIPVSNETYYGAIEEGSYKINSDGEVNKISDSSKSFDEEINVENDIILIPIEVSICNNCGERYYDRNTIQQLEKIKEKIENKEIAVEDVGKVLRPRVA